MKRLWLVFSPEPRPGRTDRLYAPECLGFTTAHHICFVIRLQVGIATAYTIVSQGLCSELALVDLDNSKVVGEALDLQHGAAFAKHIVVTGSSDYGISADSDVVVLTAGVRQKIGESRLDLVGRNLGVLKCMSTSLMGVIFAFGARFNAV